MSCFHEIQSLCIYCYKTTCTSCICIPYRCHRGSIVNTLRTASHRATHLRRDFFTHPRFCRPCYCTSSISPCNNGYREVCGKLDSLKEAALAANALSPFHNSTTNSRNQSVPNQVHAYAAQRLVVHRSDCHVQATRRLQSFIPFSSVIKVADVVLPEPHCKFVSSWTADADTFLAFALCPAHWLWQKCELQSVYF